MGTEGNSTLIVAFVETQNNRELIEAVEKVSNKYNQASFKTHLSGTPYVVEMIRRQLTSDLKVFTASAILVFAIALLAIFRSLKIVIGAVSTCVAAVCLTLIGLSWISGGLGPLTANLATIVFVLTLSHIVFVTGNWKTLSNKEEKSDRARIVSDALKRTRTPSLYCMATTLLGFGSLLFVSAEPLRQLGQGGLIGTVAAFFAAYVIYPGFLKWTPPATQRTLDRQKKWAERAQKHTKAISISAILVACGLGIGLSGLRTDPSLLSYFNSNGEIGSSLTFIDKNGGSSPLIFVVSDTDGKRLDTSSAYDRMWDLQNVLQDQPGVGSIVSLPLLLAEADSHPLATLLTFEWLVDILSGPKYGEVAKSFLSEDRTEAVFILRMIETNRIEKRVDIVGQLESVVENNGFRVSKTGGVYFLQGKLSELVAASMIQGIGILVLLFAVIAFTITRRWRPTLALTASLAFVPICLIGALGWTNTPIDIISAPSVNVIIGLAVDTMIHLSIAAKLARREEAFTQDCWNKARTEQWEAICVSVLMVGAGFSLFALSGFPPTQRFGLEIVLGTALAGLATLFLLPWLGAEQKKSRTSAQG